MPSRRTVRPWFRRTGICSSACGIRPPARNGGGSRAMPNPFSSSPFPRTARRCSRPARTIGPACGTWLPASSCTTSSCPSWQRQARGCCGSVSLPMVSRGFWTEDEEHGIRLWNIGAGKELRRFAGHTDKVHSACPSPDGKLLATASQDQTVRLWDMATGKELRRLIGHRMPILHLTFSPNGWMVCGTGERYFCAWEPTTGSPLAFDTEARGQRVWAFSPDSTVMIYAGGRAPRPKPAGKAIVNGKEVELKKDESPAWFRDAVNFGQLNGAIAGHPGQLTCTAFSPDGKRLVSASQDGTMLLWDASSFDPGRNAPVAPPVSDQPRGLWSDLASVDGRTIYRSSWQLVAAPQQGVALLRKNLRAAKKVPAEQVRIAIAELDDDRLEVRQRAFARLREIGITAEPSLRKALAESPSAEVRFRAERLLEELARPRVRRASPGACPHRLARSPATPAPPGGRHRRRLADGGSPGDFTAAGNPAPFPEDDRGPRSRAARSGRSPDARAGSRGAALAAVLRPAAARRDGSDGLSERVPRKSGGIDRHRAGWPNAGGRHHR